MTIQGVRELLNVIIFLRPKNQWKKVAKKIDFAASILSSHFKMKYPFLLLPTIFKEYLNTQVNINKMLNGHSVN